VHERERPTRLILIKNGIVGLGHGSDMRCWTLILFCTLVLLMSLTSYYVTHIKFFPILFSLEVTVAGIVNSRLLMSICRFPMEAGVASLDVIGRWLLQLFHHTSTYKFFFCCV
jgi:hypothetical protein